MENREYIEYKIYINGKKMPIIEEQIIQGRYTLETRLNEIKNTGVFEKQEPSSAVWYPPQRIVKVEYKHINGFK